MGLREVMQKSPMVGIVVALLLAALAAAIIMKPKAKPSLGDAYYYNLSTGEVFVHTKQATPPIDVPGGGAGMGVRAHVYGCGDCSEANRRVGFIEKYSDDAIAAMNTIPTDDEDQFRVQQTIMQGRLVAYPPADGGEPQWVSGETPAGRAVIDGAPGVCGNAGGTRCNP